MTVIIITNLTGTSRSLKCARTTDILHIEAGAKCCCLRQCFQPLAICRPHASFPGEACLTCNKTLGCGCAFLGSWHVVTGPLGIQEPPVNVYRHITRRGAEVDVECEASLTSFMRRLKPDSCLIPEYLLCPLRGKDAISHSGL